MSGEWILLLHIAKNCGLYKSLNTSTIKLAKETQTSQQTVSRLLRELEKKGFIKRNVSFQGIGIMLDDKGKEYLRDKHNELKDIFSTSIDTLKAKVFSGIGEGKRYTNIYEKKIKDAVGFKPCPGTLNLKATKEEIYSFLSALSLKRVEGFKQGNRTYGAVNCYKVLANNEECIALVPERTNHDKNTIELISHINLRKKLKLKDGDEITICQKQ